MTKDFFLSLNELRMASRTRHRFVLLRQTKLLKKTLVWLVGNGYIHGFETVSKNIKPKYQSSKNYYKVYLKFFENGRGLLSNIKILSKPSKISYIKIKDFNAHRANYLLLTPRGLMLFFQARKHSLGGIGIFSI